MAKKSFQSHLFVDVSGTTQIVSTSSIVRYTFLKTPMNVNFQTVTGVPSIILFSLFNFFFHRT